eukprot:CAMPEP_0119334188 /NCGR_PEP_ID=MMETSP1333-20130426/86781_1 /TAXON_ID=418940 /ORGANISM="Scyphosphaera apsteinii, Strain RCC1455" /LENGTH=323 /DNA_ID=CAMNT_0007344429 /DNA_START=84 /DNA_END=1055 /DNA_ORIENTATION=-
MSNDYFISGRTMDLGPIPGLEWSLANMPRASALHPQAGPIKKAKYGSVGIVFRLLPNQVTGGLNEAGLSCDEQTLITTQMPPPTNTSRDVNVKYFCQWALSNFATTDEVHAALLNGTAHIWGTNESSAQNGLHHSLRDATGHSLVVEYVDSQMQVYRDLNDGGKTGYGVMTNEPEYPFMVRLVQHTEWKRTLARPGVTMPGTWYPDHRFMRLHFVKEGMPKPNSLREAVMQAVHVLNTVTVPMGEQIGTDSGAGEGAGDHTMWGILYDHKEKTVYWRTQYNQNLQRLRLADIDLATGATIKYLSLSPRNELPWFNDASHSFRG